MTENKGEPLTQTFEDWWRTVWCEPDYKLLPSRAAERIWNTALESLQVPDKTGSIEWQSIETAPSDGTSILVWDGWSLEVARWGYDDLWQHEPKEWIIGEAEGEYNSYNTVNATHWMPLPDPPKREALEASNTGA